MSEDIYEVLALGMRYWFVLLGVIMVWRTFRWLRKDRREKHRRLRQLPDAGMIGELVVLVGSDELPEGTAIPVPREGVLGFLRTCDIVVPISGVAAHHLDFTFRDGKGLLLRPWRGLACQVDGDELTHRTNPKAFPMHHGSRLFIGDAVLRLRVFAGLEDIRHAAYVDEEEPELSPEQPLEPAAWQETPYVYHQQPAPWQDTGRFQPVNYQPGQPYEAANQPQPYQQPYQPVWQEPPRPIEYPPEAYVIQDAPEVNDDFDQPAGDFDPVRPRTRRERRYRDET